MGVEIVSAERMSSFSGASYSGGCVAGGVNESDWLDSGAGTPPHLSVP